MAISPPKDRLADVEASAGRSGETTPLPNSEETPLLTTSPSETSLEIAKRDTAAPYFVVAREEMRWMASSSSLTILTLMLQSSFYFVNVMSVSHLGSRELAAMSLSVTCMGIIALAPSFGLMSAMDTFCSTAFTASADKKMVGFHLQRGLVAAVVHLLCAAPLLWNAEWLLLLLRQDPGIAHLSGTYLRIQILGVLPWSVFEACKRYLQAQGIMRASTIVTMVIAPIHWINNFLLVRSPTYGIGFIGAPIVTVVSNWLMCIGILLFIRVYRLTETWGGWDVRVLGTMYEFYRLAIPSVITVCAEWVGFELLTIGTSYFGANQLAGQAITLNTVGLIFHISNGLGVSTSPRVGNLIGAAKPRRARIAADVSLVASTFTGTLGLLFMVFCGEWWTSVYTTDPDVARETAKLMPVACVFIISDGLNAVLGAILRGLGRQKASANTYMFGFYGCAVPLALYLGYGLGMEALGLWWGLCTGVIISSTLQIVYIYWWMDWSDEVRRCLVRLQRGAIQS